MRTHDDRGAAAVEFALLMPLLVVLICGIIDFGRAYQAKLTLTQAVREGVRVMALTNNQDLAGTRTRDVAWGLEKPATSAFEVAVTVSASCSYGELVELSADYDYAYITPLSELLAIIPGASGLTSPVTIQAKASMRCGG